jgi:hypothetical protein
VWLHRLHKLFDQRIKLLLRRGRLAQAEIERIGAQRLVDRADVASSTGSRQLGGTAAHTVLELQLADRDAHTVSANVTEAENAPPCRNADEAHVPRRPVAQHLGDAAFHLARDVHAARVAVDVAEREAGVGDGRVIDDRHETRRIGLECAVDRMSRC